MEHNGGVGSSMRNVYNTGKITAQDYVGGVVGGIYTTAVNNVINVGVVNRSSEGTKIGDVCGEWGSDCTWENGTWLETSNIDENGLKRWTAEEVKANLGNNFMKDPNGGTPILTWQFE